MSGSRTRISNNKNHNNNDNKQLSPSFSSGSSDSNQSSDSSVHDDDNDHTCLICAENTKIISLSPCNHEVCHLCSFRNIALYKKNQCLVCRTETTKFIFTDNLDINKYESVKQKDLISPSKHDYGIRFTSEYAKDETLKLMEYTCPIKNCNMEGTRMNNFKELNNHVKDVHGKFYCELCVKFKKAFIPELKLYNRKQLHAHQSKGDSAGFKGHPECKFCTNKRFYSEDELYIHMRDSHERCHICQQIDPSNPQYFRNYDHLNQHFQTAHYTCNVQSCLDQKFVVFPDEIALKTHLVQEHSAIYGNNILSTNTFNNQLFTVSNSKNTKKKHTQNDQANDTEKNYELKRKRLEERAKHYLNYNADKFTEFQKVNDDYSKELISASDVNNKYQQIFKGSKDVDYTLLIYELSGLYPSKSQLRKNLELINQPQLNQRALEENFPSLPGTSISASLWDPTINHSQPKAKGSSKLKKFSNNSALFPELPGSSSIKNKSGPKITIKQNKTLKTRGISSNVPTNGYSVPGYNPISDNSGNKTKNQWGKVPTPSYSSTSLAPSLSSSSSASSSSSSSLLSSSTANRTSIISSYSTPVARKAVDPTLFPSLPNAPPKKVIPRVKPVNNDSGVWSASSSSAAASLGSSNDAFNMNEMGVSIKAVKKGKKGTKFIYQFD